MPWLVTNKSSKRTDFLYELGKCTQALVLHSFCCSSARVNARSFISLNLFIRECTHKFACVHEGVAYGGYDAPAEFPRREQPRHDLSYNSCDLRGECVTCAQRGRKVRQEVDENEQAAICAEAIYITNNVIQASWRVHERYKSIQVHHVLRENFGHRIGSNDCLNAPRGHGNRTFLVTSSGSIARNHDLALAPSKGAPTNNRNG